MATTSKVYGPSLLSLLNGEIDFDTNTIKALLLTSGYTPNQDTHRYRSDLTSEVASGNGYATGGVTLTGKTVTYDAATNTVTIDADDPAWPASTITCRYIVFYRDTGTAATSALISWADFGADQSSTAGTFTYQIPTTGIATYQAP